MNKPKNAFAASGLALCLGIAAGAKAWAVDTEVLCARWSAHEAAFNARRDGSAMTKLTDKARNSVPRADVDFTSTEPGLDKADRIEAKGADKEYARTQAGPAIAAQTPAPRDAAARRIAEDIDKIQDQTRAVLEENIRWTAAVKDMNIELIPVSKASYPDFARALIAEIESNANGRELGSLKQELLYNPLSLSKFIPGPAVQAANCGDHYLIYQPVAPGAPETKNPVTLGNVAKIWENNVSVTGQKAAPASKP